MKHSVCGLLILLLHAAVPSIVSAEPPSPKAPGCAWLSKNGMRAAWLSYKQIDDQMVEDLIVSRVNTVFLKHGFHDLLQLDTAHWEGPELVVKPKTQTVDRALESSRRAAQAGIHVLWVANYELEQMLPHLERLGYQSAFAEGPGRFLPAGPHQDAAPLDRTFWRGITGAHGDLIAKLSRSQPIVGILYDTEHYAGGMMYLQNSGFSDLTFRSYASSRHLDESIASTPAGRRYDQLKSAGRLADYYAFLEEQAYEQGRYLARRWHRINPRLIFGIWPLLDNWFSQGMLRGLGGAVPALGLSGVEYYHGSDQSRAMAEFFESRNPNLIYLPGFYPPYAYSTDQLEQHVAQAIRKNRHYWMLGPHAELRQPKYQTALRNAYLAAKPSAAEHEPIQLRYHVAAGDDGPVLNVATKVSDIVQVPRLSLWVESGGAALCTQMPMRLTDDGEWTAQVRLLRRITNNRYLKGGFRSGVSYRLVPVPREFWYEDPYHTKLIDGRAYGYFGTTVAWSNTIQNAAVQFDFHRAYRIHRVEVSQPSKLEDRNGGPSELKLRLEHEDSWQAAHAFAPHFDVSGPDGDASLGSDGYFDRRHRRGWLSWRVDLPAASARRMRIELSQLRSDRSISLGEVSVWGVVDGQIQAAVTVGDQTLEIRDKGRGQIQLPD